MLSEECIKVLDARLGNVINQDSCLEDIFTGFTYSELLQFARTCYNLGVNDSIELMEDERFDVEENVLAKLIKLTT